MRTYTRGCACTDSYACTSCARCAGANPNAENKNSETPLTLAVTTGNTVAISALVDCGAELDRANAKGMTALLLALRKDARNSAVALLECGAKGRGRLVGDLHGKENWNDHNDDDSNDNDNGNARMKGVCGGGVRNKGRS